MLQNDFNIYNTFKSDPDDTTLTIRKLDANIDIMSTDFEKRLKRLPSNLKFVKKYLYYDLLPKVDKYIEELEHIKQTPNYDEKIPNIRPQSVSKVSSQITCLDLFETHNIKHMKTSRIIYGTINGNIVVYDLESQRILCEKSIGVKARIEIVSTSTIKYFDSYVSRIAVTSRNDPNINIFTYNHSYTVIKHEGVINLKEGISTDLSNTLSSLPSSIKISKDSFFMLVGDYSGGVRIYKFNDIPQTNTGGAPQMNKPIVKSEMTIPLNFQIKKDKKELTANIPESDSNLNNGTGIFITPILISYIKYKEVENYTIIKRDDTKSSGNTNNANSTNNANNAKNAGQQKAPAKPQTKDTKNLPATTTTTAPDENVYNHISQYDNNGNDLTPIHKFNKHHPFFSFVQKKVIFEEKLTGGFATCLLTVGVYIAFYCTNNLKFVSLYSHLTDNMKNVFKVVKTKGGAHLSVEESMTLSSSISRREKEYMVYLKAKLESLNSGNTGISNINSIPVSYVSNLNVKDASKAKNEKIEINTTINSPNTDIATKSEINFNTLYSITSFTCQKIFNNHNNLLSVGMNNGSILVWDTELHIDKFLFQEDRGEIISLSIDENYLISGSLDGQAHIYELINGNQIYKCYHNTHFNYPIQLILPFFPFMSLAIDTDEKICLYNNKEKEKAGKIILENSNKKYKISYFNKLVLGYSEEYLVFSCNKNKMQKEKRNLLDLIRFQKQEDKPVIEEFKSTPFINHFQNLNSKSNLEITKSYLVVLKTKDIMNKVYPQLIMASKKGLSIKKIMSMYNIKNLPSFEKKDKITPHLFSDLASNNNLKSQKFSSLSLNKVEEKIDEEDISIKKHGCVKENDNSINEDELKNMKINLIKTSTNNTNKDETKMTIITEETKEKKHKEQSTQKKNIFYYSFKNIRERYQYKEQRANKIQMRNNKIMKELTPNEITLQSENNHALNGSAKIKK